VQDTTNKCFFNNSSSNNNRCKYNNNNSSRNNNPFNKRRPSNVSYCKKLTLLLHMWLRYWKRRKNEGLRRLQIQFSGYPKWKCHKIRINRTDPTYHVANPKDTIPLIWHSPLPPDPIVTSPIPSPFPEGNTRMHISKHAYKHV
jgi:hypothetical protein